MLKFILYLSWFFILMAFMKYVLESLTTYHKYQRIYTNKFNYLKIDCLAFSLNDLIDSFYLKKIVSFQTSNFNIDK